MSRMHTVRLSLASVLPIVLMACGSPPPSAAAIVSSAESVTSPNPESPPSSAQSSTKERLKRMPAAALPTDDCTLLSEATLRRHFPKAPAQMETRVRLQPYPSCTYLWASTTPGKRTIAGRVVEIAGEGRVTITVAPIRSPKSDWQRVLSSYRTAPVPVEGIGDKAVWSDQRHQLSVLVPAFVAHVAVEDNDNPGSTREKAIAVARDVLADLP